MDMGHDILGDIFKPSSRDKLDAFDLDGALFADDLLDFGHKDVAALSIPRDGVVPNIGPTSSESSSSSSSSPREPQHYTEAHPLSHWTYNCLPLQYPSQVMLSPMAAPWQMMPVAPPSHPAAFITQQSCQYGSLPYAHSHLATVPSHPPASACVSDGEASTDDKDDFGATPTKPCPTMPDFELPAGCLQMGRPMDRKARLQRYQAKRKRRTFEKTIRYQSRKAYAEIRPRIKGRFATREEVKAMKAAAAAGLPYAELDDLLGDMPSCDEDDGLYKEDDEDESAC